MRVLIVSPIPSHPQDQGNSARIAALGQALQSAGLLVDFLYHPLEGLTPAQATTMARAWDGFHVVPVERFSLATRADGMHRLDDWYDPRVGQAAADLHARYRYAAIIANYVWFSAVLDAVGTGPLTILDTHDVFGGRGDRFVAAGMEPAWFRTSPAEEARGLMRADVVLAIQQDEAQVFGALGHPDVRVLGHLHPRRTRRGRAGAGTLSIGYLASFNPINLDSFRVTRDAVRAVGLPLGTTLLVAGTICERLADPDPFVPLGRLDHTDLFYDRIDLAINPMGWGTGLKIKSVEALFEGVPLAATATAMTGLPAIHPLHRLADARALAEALPGVDAAVLDGLRTASAACAATYGRQVRAALRTLVADISARGAGTAA